MKRVTLGVRKKAFRSIAEAAQAAGIPYITFYQRIRAGVPSGQAFRQPVRAYKRRKAR